MSEYDDRLKRGFEKLEEMGRQGSMLNQKELSEDLYEMSVGHLFGDIWNRPLLSMRERQLITLAANIALCRPTGNHSHYRSAQHLGITRDEIMEVIIQTGAYSGWPTMAHATHQFTEVIEEDEAKAKAAEEN
jgi:alkylhydroperoxidase/carboxymuconolactone decarboxylase family protein YurZ